MASATEEEHLVHLGALVEGLQHFWPSTQHSQWFGTSNMEFMAHTVDAAVARPLENKVVMIWAMAALNTVKLLKAFLSPKQPAHRRPKRQRKKSFSDNLVCPEAGAIRVSQGGPVFSNLPGAQRPEVLV